MAEKNNNIFLHGYHFLRDHWGELYVGYDLLRGFISKEKPSEDAHAVVKLVHGGKNDIIDEIAYEAIESNELSPEERKLLEEFRNWMKTDVFGTSIWGRRDYASWDNNFRGMIMRMREPARTEFDTTTTKDAKGKDVVKKSERHVPVNNTPAVEFLKRFTRLIQDAHDRTRGSKAQKVAAGNQAARSYLYNYNMPSDKSAQTVRTVGAVATQISEKGLVAAKATRRKAKKKAIGLIREARTLNETLTAKEASLPWWRRLMRF